MVTKKSAPAVAEGIRQVGVRASFAALGFDALLNYRVVDAETGEVIDKVIDADADAGKVRRFAVEDGNLVRDGDAFRVIEEDRAIRIEWINPPAADEQAGGAEQSEA